MATTTNWALPYPVSTATPDVPRDIQALAVQVESVLNTGVHEKVVGPYGFSAQNTFTNVTAAADFPVSADATALTISFTKFASSTKLVLTAYGTASLQAGVQQSGILVIAIGATNYDVGRGLFPVATSRAPMGGMREVTGLAAGTYTIKLRFYAATASSVSFYPVDDTVSFSVREIS